MNKKIKNFLPTCPLALATLLIPCFLGSDQILTSALLLVAGLLMLSIDWSPRSLLFWIIVLVSGPIAEATAIYFGLWTYANPVFMGVPIWLFFVWGNSGVYLFRLKEAIFA